MSVSAGADLARARLREVGTSSALILALAFELGVALLERAHGRPGAADRALAGGAFGVALPLLGYFLATRVCAGGGLRAAVQPLARHGHSRHTLLLGLALPPALLLAGFAAGAGACVVAITRGASDPFLFRDLATCLWIGAVAGVAYVLTFLGASAFGKDGRGRAWLLAGDFFLGAGSSFWALPWPKGHVRNLLGGAPVLELSQASALLLLLGTSFAFLGWGLNLSKR